MAISARLATARRTILTVSLCAALAAGAGTRPADAFPGVRGANASPQPAHGAVFAPFGAMLAGRASSGDVHSIAITGNLIPVTNCADDGSDGTLRKAIEGAADGDTIDMSGLNCSLITLQSGALTTSIQDLALKGSGMDSLTIDGNNADHVVMMLGSGNLDISDVTIAHGIDLTGWGGGCVFADGNLSLTRTKLDSCVVADASGTAVGGGAMVLGNLTMRAATISSSQAAGTTAAGGGAIVGGTATLYDSVITGNSAQATQFDAYGGGIYANGAIALHSSIIESNVAHSESAPAYGGGLHSAFSDISVADGSTISSNTARSEATLSYGGGVNSGKNGNPIGATVTISRSTITGNASNSACTACVVSGAGVHAVDSILAEYSTVSYNEVTCDDPTSQCSTSGGGLSAVGLQASSNITLRNTTISGNNAIGGTQGGAFSVGGGVMGGPGLTIVAHNSTIAFNHASTNGGGISATSSANSASELIATIVANNDTDAGPDDIDAGPFGNNVSFAGSSSLVMSPAAGVTLPAGTLPDDPMLQPLTTGEGGATAVHPLGIGSAAIDAGANPDSLGCDQRGFPYRRAYGSSADIGAYEFQGEPHLFADNFDASPACPPAP
jgi:hypothetical protein